MKIIKELSIKEEQQIQLNILKYFDEICRKEKLSYYLAYGTLLGAAREKGFISWDDDIDLWMMREDYDKFNSIFHKYQTKEYFLQNVSTDPNMVVPSMTRICVNETYKWPFGCEKEKFHTGIYFDIFPLDFGTNNSNNNKKRIKHSARYHSMLWDKLKIAHKMYSFKDKLFVLVARAFPRPIINYLLLKIVKKRKNYNDKVLICYPASGIFPNNVYDARLFEKIVYLEFEDIKCPCPSGYEELLTQRYGDWKIPAKTKPVHVPAFVIKVDI